MLILGSMSVGILIGIQLSSGTDSPVSNQTTESPPDNPTPTPISGPNQTPHENMRTTSPQSPNRQLQDVLLSTINSYRIQHGRSPLDNTGPPTDQLRQIATNHSQDMATVGVARISLRGSTSSDRYSEARINKRCSFPSNSGYSTIDPSVGKLELVANPVRAPPYENVEGGYNGDPSTVAESALNTWTSSNQDRRKLLYKNAEQAGIGVVITDRGSVYLTVSLCGA
jgi:uncharacterized protein YkwD